MFILRSDEIPCSTICELPTDKPMILFSAGGGYWPYYLGIAKYIKEHYELSNVSIVGTSAGGVAVLALTQCTPMDDLLSETLAFTDTVSKCWFGVFSLQWSRLYKQTIVQSIARNGYRKCTNSFIAVSKWTWFGFSKRYFIADSNPNAIADTAIASSWLPFITAPLFQPFYYIGGSYYADGIWSGKDKINKKNTIVIYPWRFTRFPLYMHWLWLGRDYNTGLYTLGYEHASKHKDIFSILPKLYH